MRYSYNVFYTVIKELLSTILLQYMQLSGAVTTFTSAWAQMEVQGNTSHIWRLAVHVPNPPSKSNLYSVQVSFSTGLSCRAAQLTANFFCSSVILPMGDTVNVYLHRSYRVIPLTRFVAAVTSWTS